ncbi:MAG TPA: DUF3096 domain-containing protein [Actinomycetota bacterium]|nr:DUF3096 domain-containing protein [Actinomycetota bacterium]
MLALMGLAAKTSEVEINFTVRGIVALGAGILILIFPKVLNYIVAAYLIFIGVVELFDLRF